MGPRLVIFSESLIGGWEEMVVSLNRGTPI